MHLVQDGANGRLL